MAPATVFVLQPLATPEHIGFLSQGTQMLLPNQLAQAALTSEKQCWGKGELVSESPFPLSSLVTLSSSSALQIHLFPH